LFSKCTGFGQTTEIKKRSNAIPGD